jgi:ATP-dependent helicase HrpB
MQSLPIDSLLPDIIQQLSRNPNLVIEAPPGAGKTTRVPAALLDAGLAVDGEVWVLEPRRLAARLAARRVAEERGDKLGETIGYQVRFEEVAGPRTRLRFLTEGVLTRRLLSNPQLVNVGLVVLDEFHERHLHADLALALLRRLQKEKRPDLKLVVMSATLAAAPIAAYLGNAPTLRSEGKQFDVAIEHLMRPDDRPVAAQIAAAVKRLADEKIDGDILVFLPGAAEIRKAQTACSVVAEGHDLLVLPLHGELSAAQQDRAVQPAAQRKLILSTNVAESSVTIDGVAAVIDSGLARIAGHSPWSGLPTLNVSRISRASAEQRAGRAGRTRPGRCLRLYTAQDFNARPDYETAEIHRLDLAEPALELHAAGIRDARVFEWFEPPPQRAMDAADNLLKRLGAIDEKGDVTPAGARMLRFPLHPRQSRMIDEARSRGVGNQVSIIAALIGERDIVATDLFKDERRRAQTTGPSDLLDRLDLFEQAARSNFSGLRDLDAGAVMAVERVRKQLQRLVEKNDAAASKAEESDILISILAGYPDRVARRRSLKSGNAELLLSNGGAASLSTSSVVMKSEFLVAVDAEERRDAGKLVRIASAIEPEWLIDLFIDQMRETTECRWNAQTERVEIFKRLLYDKLVIDESRANEADSDEAARILAEAALAAGPQRFVDSEVVEKFIARVDFVARTFPEAGLPVFDDSDVREALIALCAGLSSFSQLREAAGRGGLIESMRRKLSPEQKRSLSRDAPEDVAIAGRRQVRVNYERGKPPWIESRLQDFFGMTEGPRIAGGRVPLVLHLLAPNRRPVQVTTDLAGFWERMYPQVRRELSRKYPRHAWPENPVGR